MTSEKKVEANRANARASTGPKSGPGKAIARLNALTHGAFATLRLLPDEDATEYEKLSSRVLADTKPKTAIESMLADQIIADMWRIIRIERAELTLFEQFRKSNFARALQDLSPDEFEIAEEIVDDEEQLHVARQRRQEAAEQQRRANPLGDLNFGLLGGEMRPRITSARPELISNIVKRKLDETRGLEALLLDAMASDNRAAPYAALESMRRTLVRDIVRHYASLVELQERRQTIEPIKID